MTRDPDAARLREEIRHAVLRLSMAAAASTLTLGSMLFLAAWSPTPWGIPVFGLAGDRLGLLVGLALFGALWGSMCSSPASCRSVVLAEAAAESCCGSSAGAATERRVKSRHRSSQGSGRAVMPERPGPDQGVTSAVDRHVPLASPPSPRRPARARRKRPEVATDRIDLSVLAPDRPSLADGTGRYEELDLLGQGGMGTVQRVRDRKLGSHRRDEGAQGRAVQARSAPASGSTARP